MDQTLITVSRYSITYYQNDLFICAQYANKHKATALHKAYWLPCCFFFLNSLLLLLFQSLLFAVSLENLSAALIGWCIWHFRTKCQSADHRAIVYCLLRKSLGCLNWLVYMARLGAVSIG